MTIGRLGRGLRDVFAMSPEVGWTWPRVLFASAMFLLGVWVIEIERDDTALSPFFAGFFYAGVVYVLIALVCARFEGDASTPDEEE